MEPTKPMAIMKPMEPLKCDPPWWPEELGQAASSGTQNGMRYAFFPQKRRLLVEREGIKTVYDSGDLQISGVSQQSGASWSFVFTSQTGPVALDTLPRRGALRRRNGTVLRRRESARHLSPGNKGGRLRRPAEGPLLQPKARFMLVFAAKS